MRNLDKWLTLLPKDIIEKMVDIKNKINQIEDNGTKVYPPESDRFKALELVDPKDLKVVIIGQDPYHGEGQAMGLSFSVNKGVKIPPSLRNIFKELNNDLDIPIPGNGDLTPWAKQGVLLLNSCLTVEAKKPASHKDLGWQDFTKEIVKLTLEMPQPIVYLCWGKFSLDIIEKAKKECEIEGAKEILTSTHPSPFSANNKKSDLKPFIGSKPFSKTNEILIENDSKPIDWKI